jgi:cytoskeletal protein CcmA (bactofilin family)
MRLARLLLLVTALLLAVGQPAAAAEVRQGDLITVPAAEALNDDLYAFGRTVSVLGTVRGDLVAFAETVTIEGTVTGDVITAARQVTVGGEVGGSLRAAAADIAADGRVAEDVIAGSGGVTVGANGRVGRDIVAGSGSVILQGQIGRDVLAGATEMTIDGRVGRDVRLTVDRLRLTDRAVVEGMLSYTSEREAEVASGATIRGRVERTQPDPVREPEVAGAPAGIFDWLRTFVGFLALGLLLVFLFPGFARRSGAALTRMPLISLAIGFGVLFGLPVLALLVLILGSLVGGWWIAFVALALYAVAIIVSIPIAGIGIGAWILRAGWRGAHVAVALVIGLALLLLIAIVPVLGGFALFLAILFGLGALAVALRGEPAPAAV